MQRNFHSRARLWAWLSVAVAANLPTGMYGAGTLSNTNPPTRIMRLIFIHHSTGQAWLADDHGGLGKALKDNNYFVSDTNYGWGPDGIGDNTDLGNWWQWFRGPDSARYQTALLAEGGQNCDYTRLGTAPEGGNEIVMFKSCFPNSALQGKASDPIPDISSNPLRGESSGSDAHTVANAKGIYLDLLNYFRVRPEKLFVAITAPPLSDPTYAANARAFNEWMVNEWLKDYPLPNVMVWDFFNVLTSNGGNPQANDLRRESGNHHRWWNGGVQHKTDGGGNILAYPSDDDHPNAAGDAKATAEFVPLLNAAVHAWLGTAVNPPNFSGILFSAQRVQFMIGNLPMGQSCIIQECADLAGGNWADLATFQCLSPATNWMQNFNAAIPPRMFYRIQVR